MRVNIKRQGNSAYVRISAAVMEAAALRINDTVDVRVEAGKIIIEPVLSAYGLEQLLDRITPENLHQPVEFGA